MKKTFLILFSASLLLFVLSLGQVALAAECVPPNECKLPADCSTPTPDTTDTCAEGKVCCLPAGNACAVPPNSCATCITSDRVTGTCPKTPSGLDQFCCKPKTSDPTPDAEDGGGNVKDQYGGLKPGGGGAGSVTIGPKDLSPVGTPSIPELIGIIVKGALGIVGSISLLLFVYGGFIMLISQGDATKITKGKNIMIWTSIGLMIIFGSYIFVSYIVSNLGQGGKDSDEGDGGGGGETEKQVCPSGYSCSTRGLDYICDTTTPDGACSEKKECCKPRL